MLNNASYTRPIIILGTNVEMPKMLKATTTTIEFALPTRDELSGCFDFIQQGAIDAKS